MHILGFLAINEPFELFNLLLDAIQPLLVLHILLIEHCIIMLEVIVFLLLECHLLFHGSDSLALSDDGSFHLICFLFRPLQTGF